MYITNQKSNSHIYCQAQKQGTDWSGGEASMLTQVLDILAFPTRFLRQPLISPHNDPGNEIRL